MKSMRYVLWLSATIVAAALWSFPGSHYSHASCTYSDTWIGAPSGNQTITPSTPSSASYQYTATLHVSAGPDPSCGEEREMQVLLNGVQVYYNSGWLDSWNVLQYHATHFFQPGTTHTFVAQWNGGGGWTGDVTLNLTVLEYSPAPPSNLRLASSGSRSGQAPPLVWDASPTSGVTYQLQKRDPPSDNWSVIATGSSTSYTDGSETLDWSRFGEEIQYRVRAYKDNKYSIFSNTLSVYVEGDGNGGHKRDAAGGTSLNANVPTAFALYDNFPNPFNPSTQIRFDVAERTMVILEVFDSLGRKVKRLLQQQVGPGSHTVAFDASHLPSGIYLYRIQAGSFVQAKSMVLAK